MFFIAYKKKTWPKPRNDRSHLFAFRHFHFYRIFWPECGLLVTVERLANVVCMSQVQSKPKSTQYFHKLMLSYTRFKLDVREAVSILISL